MNKIMNTEGGKKEKKSKREQEKKNERGYGLSSNSCAQKGVIKKHRTVFFLQSHCVRKNGRQCNAHVAYCQKYPQPPTGLLNETPSNLGWKHDVPQFV